MTQLNTKNHVLRFNDDVTKGRRVYQDDPLLPGMTQIDPSPIVLLDWMDHEKL